MPAAAARAALPDAVRAGGRGGSAAARDGRRPPARPARRAAAALARQRPRRPGAGAVSPAGLRARAVDFFVEPREAPAAPARPVLAPRRPPRGRRSAPRRGCPLRAAVLGTAADAVPVAAMLANALRAAVGRVDARRSPCGRPAAVARARRSRAPAAPRGRRASRRG